MDRYIPACGEAGVPVGVPAAPAARPASMAKPPSANIAATASRAMSIRMPWIMKNRRSLSVERVASATSPVLAACSAALADWNSRTPSQIGSQHHRMPMIDSTWSAPLMIIMTPSSFIQSLPSVSGRMIARTSSSAVCISVFPFPWSERAA